MFQIDYKIKRCYQNTFNGFVMLSFIINLASCSNTTSENKPTKVISENSVISNRKPPGSYNDTVIIDFPAAVFYSPDSIQLEKIKELTNPAAFESMTHENFYLMKFSRNEIQNNWSKIKIVEVRNARFILFKLKDGNNECIDLNIKNDPFGIFLFDGYKKPLLTDMPNITTDLSFYFSKK